jgi:hypothetical protein
MGDTIKRLVRQATADKKKLTLMVALMAMMLLLWGRLLLKQAPRTAIADPSQTERTQQTEQAKASQSAQPMQVVYRQALEVDLPSVVRRDLFLFDKDRYPRVAFDTSDRDSEKSDTQTPEVSRQIEEIRRWVESLVLQGAVLGNPPRAMINNRVYRLGEKLNGFEIVQVEARQIVLRKDDIEIVLPMSE